MTNLRDLLSDLVTETIEKINDNPANSNTENTLYLDEDVKEELVDDYVEKVKERLIG